MHTKPWCKTRTVWNANHGEKGERGERSSSSTAESIYIMLFVCLCKLSAPVEGTSLGVMKGNSGDSLPWSEQRLLTETECCLYYYICDIVVITSSVLFIWLIFLVDPPLLPLFKRLVPAQQFFFSFHPLHWRNILWYKTQQAKINPSETSDLNERPPPPPPHCADWKQSKNKAVCSAFT